MFPANMRDYFERGRWLHVSGQRTGGWQRMRCPLERHSVTSHALDVREGNKTQSRASGQNTTRFGTMGEQFNVLGGRKERKVSAQSSRVLERRAQLTRGTGRPKPRRRSLAPRHQPPNRHGAPAVTVMLCTNVSTKSVAPLRGSPVVPRCRNMSWASSDHRPPGM